MNDPLDIWKKKAGDREKRKQYYNYCYSLFEGDIFSDTEQKKILPDCFVETNYIEDYVEKYQSFLFPKNPRTLLFEVGVKSHNSDIDIRSKEEQAIIDVYRKNTLFDKLLSSSLDFLVAGVSAFFYYPQSFSIKIEKVDPRDCVVLYRDDELVGAIFSRLYEDFEKKHEKIFVVDSSTIKIFRDNKLIDTIKHGFGLVPFAWITDRPKPFSHEGRSLLPSLIKMDKQISETLTHFAIRVGDNTKPELAIFSDKKVGNVKKGRDNRHQFGQNDDAKYLEKKESREPLELCNFLEKRIFNKTSILYSSSVSQNAISGVSLTVQFNDMLESIAKKRIPWNQFFINLNTAILRHINSSLSDYITTPIYHSPLPLDISRKIDDTIKLRNASLISRADSIDEVRAVDDPKRALEEIDKEDKQYKIKQYDMESTQ